MNLAGAVVRILAVSLLTSAMCAALKGGATLKFGVDHPQYLNEVAAPAAVRAALTADLD